MSSKVRFSRACPTCGRNQDIPVYLIGRSVDCGFCGEEFFALLNDPPPTDHSQYSLDLRVSRLLAEGLDSAAKPSYQETSQDCVAGYEV